jgi:hypothetical protein
MKESDDNEKKWLANDPRTLMGFDKPSPSDDSYDPIRTPDTPSSKAESSVPSVRMPEPPEIGVYTIHGRLTMQDLYVIFNCLNLDKRITIIVDPGSYTDVLNDWHQIELSVIAAHERRVRGSER